MSYINVKNYNLDVVIKILNLGERQTDQTELGTVPTLTFNIYDNGGHLFQIKEVSLCIYKRYNIYLTVLQYLANRNIISALEYYCEN